MKEKRLFGWKGYLLSVLCIIICIGLYFLRIPRATTVGTVPVVATEMYSQVKETLDLVNAYREVNGAGELNLDSKLTEVAMERAYELFVSDGHRRPNDTNFRVKLRENGLTSAVVDGEVVAGSKNRSNDIARQGFDMFKASSEHDEIIRGAKYTYIGIGIAYMENEGYSWCYILTNVPITGETPTITSNKEVVKNIEVGPSYNNLVVYPDKSLEYGDSGNLKVQLGKNQIGQRANVSIDKVTFKSSDSSVATVNPISGYYEVVGPGNVTISATLSNGISGSYPATIKSKSVNSEDISVLIDGKSSEDSNGNFLPAYNFQYTYKGQEVKPKITVTNTSTKKDLIEDVDYDVSYSNKTNSGTSAITSTITVTGKGKYTGSTRRSFQILPDPNASSGGNAGGSGDDSDMGTETAPNDPIYSGPDNPTDPTPPTKPSVVKVTSIKISLDDRIEVGNTVRAYETAYPANATNKMVKWSSNNTSIATVDSNGNVKGINPGKVTITATAADGSGVKSSKTVEVYVNLKKPSVSAANSGSGITVKWSKSSSASGYIIYRRSGKGKWQKIATVKNTAGSYTDKKAKNGTLYYYTVRSYRGSAQSSYDKVGKPAYRLTNIKLSSTSNKKGKKLYAKWKKNTKATGYQIQYSTNKAFSGAKTKTVKGGSKSSYTLTKLSKGKTYYVRIRAYYSKKGVKSYTSWSNTKSVKIKK